MGRGRANTWVYVYPTPGNPRTGRGFKNDGCRRFMGFAFHPSDKYRAATSNDQTVRLLDTESGELTKTYTWAVARRAVVRSRG